MVTQEQKCSQIETCEPIKVSTAGDSLEIKKRGQAQIYTVDGKGLPRSVTLKNSLISPTLQFNLISVSKMDLAGHYIIFGDGRVQVVRGVVPIPSKCEVTAVGTLNRAGLYVLNSEKRSKLYAAHSTNAEGAEQNQSRKLDAICQKELKTNSEKATSKLAEAVELRDFMKESMTEMLFAQEKSEQSKMTWKLAHRRFGHPSEGALRKIVESNGIKIDGGIGYRCDTCPQAKAKKAPFRSSAHFEIAKHPGETWHLDAMGPLRTATLGGKRYFLFATDDATRFVRCYGLHTKDQQLDCFKDLMAWSETQTGRKIKMIRTDGEWASTAFNRIKSSSGFEHKMTTPGTPESNGVAERLGGIITQKARAMLLDAGLPPTFAGEAINTATYLHNLTIAGKGKQNCPAELFYGRAIQINHLRAFGSLAFARLHLARPGKMGTRGHAGVLVGYDLEKRAYRIFLTEQKKIAVSRDVTFDETRRGWPRSLPGLENTTQLFDSPEYVEFGDLEDDEKESAISYPVAEREPDAPREVDSPPPIIHDDILDDQASDEKVMDEEIPIPQTEERELPRRSARAWNPTGKCLESLANTAYMMFAASLSYNDVKGKMQWKNAMDSEYKNLVDLKTFQLVDRPRQRKVIPTRWVYQQKAGESGKEKYKARIVVKGFKQVYGLDYDMTWAPTPRAVTVRFVAAQTARDRSRLRHIDIRAAFLNAELRDHEIYVEPPEGVNDGKKVWLLKKALYGLKQAGMEWSEDFCKTLLGMKFKRSVADPCLFFQQIDRTMVLIVVYVDDCLIKYDTDEQLKRVVDGLKRKYAISDLGLVKHALGIEFEHTADGMVLSQGPYIKTVLERFGFEEAHPTDTPCSLVPSSGKASGLRDHNMNAIVGALLWLSLNTRPEISYAVARLAQTVANPDDVAYASASRILRYLAGTRNVSISYSARTREQLTGFADADWAGDSDRKSQTGYLFMMAGGPVCWGSKKQTCVALSTAEAEIVAASTCAQEAMWFRSLFEELGLPFPTPIVIHEDNAGAIALANTSVTGKRTKHIDLRYHFLNDAVKQGRLKLQKIDAKKNLADIFTKPLARDRFQELARHFTVRSDI
jgi:hypothetical protein